MTDTHGPSSSHNTNDAIRYEQVADKAIVQMSDAERDHLTHLMQYPTEEYRALVVALAVDGCEFPKQQAALMLRNAPGVAAKIIEVRDA